MHLHLTAWIHFVDVYSPSILKVFILPNDFLFNEILDCFSVECDLSTLRMAMIQKTWFCLSAAPYLRALHAQLAK